MESARTSQDTAYTLKMFSRAVLTDVIATDKHGNPVTGLTQPAVWETFTGRSGTVVAEVEVGKPGANQPVT